VLKINIDKILAALQSLLVISMSSMLGSVLPEGWLLRKTTLELFPPALKFWRDLKTMFFEKQG